MPAPSALLIDHGDMPALAALAMQSDPSTCVLWHPVEPGPAGEKRHDLVRQKAEAFSAEFIESPSPAACAQLDTHRDGLLLLAGCAIAWQQSIKRIIWPGRIGPEPTQLLRWAELTEHVSRIMRLSGVDPVIDAPLIDLTPVHVVDLAQDSGAPMRLFWPFGESGKLEDDPEAIVWREAFASMGQVWPWAAAAM